MSSMDTAATDGDVSSTAMTIYNGGVSSTDTPVSNDGDLEMALVPSNKRDHESLFVNDDEDSDDAGGRNSKKSKIDHDSTYSSQRDSFEPVTINGMVPPYDSLKAEGRPHLAPYHPAYPDIEQGTTQINDHFISIYEELKANGFVNPEVESIITGDYGIKYYRSPHASYNSVKPIVLLGPAGAGKSSGTNCYTDQQGVAAESDSGSRGTSVVHEYSKMVWNQTTKYVVEVQYMLPEQVRTLVRNHCNTIFKQLNRAKNDLEEQEIDELQEKYETARDFFLTLLGHLDDFQNERKLGEYFQEALETLQNEDEDLDGKEFLAETVGYVEELLDSKAIRENQNKEIFPANSEAELDDISLKILGPSDMEFVAGRMSYTWPLATMIKVHRDLDLFRAGVVLADAPGVTDTNQGIVQNTKNYLKNAGTIFVFAEPERIFQDADLDANLRECIRLQKERETYLIVTKIDEKKKFTPVEVARLSAGDRDTLQAAQDQVLKLQTEKGAVKAAKGSAKGFNELRSLDQRFEELEVAVKKAEANVMQVTIQIRNNSFEKKLKGKIRELQGWKKAPDLKIIFTSNKEYQKHLAGYDAKDPPILDIEATGIPAVRRVLYEVPVRGRLTFLSNVIRRILPSRYNGIAGILTRSRLERKQDVENLINKVFEEDEKTIVAQILAEVRAKFEERVQETFSANVDKWQRAAEAKVDQWQDFNSGTFGAFCRKDGDWKLPVPKGTPKNRAKKIDWNLDLQNMFAPKVNNGFDKLLEDVDTVKEDSVSKVASLYLRLEEELKACDAFQGADTTPFFVCIREMRDDVITGFNEYFDEFKNGINAIRNYTTGDPKQSCTVEAMQPTYHQCVLMASGSYAPSTRAIVFKDKNGKQKKRTGAHPSRVEAIRNKVTGHGVLGVYPHISQIVGKYFDSAMNNWREKLKRKLDEGSAGVLQDFKHRFDATEIKTEEGEEFKERLLTEIEKAKESLAEMSRKLEECEAYENSG